MALAGFDTPILVFSSSATNSSYGGTVTGVTAGNLYAVCLMACSDSSLNTPSSWTVTLGSDTMAYRSGQSSNGVFGFTAWFTVVATGSGDLSLSVTTSNNCRSMAGYAFDITGFDTTTPIPNAGQADSHSSNTTTLTTPNGVTTAADGNAILGCVSVKGGDVTNLAVGAADGSVTGQTGGNATSDNEWGIAWDRTPTAASVTFAWTWTGADRPGAAWIEVAEATASGTDVPAAKATLNLTANQASIANDVSVTGAAASLAITPLSATISTAANVDVSASPAALQITANPAAISVDANVGASPANLQITPNAATVSTTSNVNVNADVSALQVSPNPAAVSLDVVISAATASLQITGQSASIDYGVNVSVLPAALRIDGKAASVVFNVGVTASAANLQINPYAATISDGGLSERRSASPGTSATGGTFARSGTGGLITRSIKSGSIV